MNNERKAYEDIARLEEQELRAGRPVEAAGWKVVRNATVVNATIVGGRSPTIDARNATLGWKDEDTPIQDIYSEELRKAGYSATQIASFWQIARANSRKVWRDRVDVVLGTNHNEVSGRDVLDAVKVFARFHVAAIYNEMSSQLLNVRYVYDLNSPQRRQYLLRRSRVRALEMWSAYLRGEPGVIPRYPLIREESRGNGASVGGGDSVENERRDANSGAVTQIDFDFGDPGEDTTIGGDPSSDGGSAGVSGSSAGSGSSATGSGNNSTREGGRRWTPSQLAAYRFRRVNDLMSRELDKWFGDAAETFEGALIKLGDAAAGQLDDWAADWVNKILPQAAAASILHDVLMSGVKEARKDILNKYQKKHSRVRLVVDGGSYPYLDVSRNQGSGRQIAYERVSFGRITAIETPEGIWLEVADPNFDPDRYGMAYVRLYRPGKYQRYTPVEDAFPGTKLGPYEPVQEKGNARRGSGDAARHNRVVRKLAKETWSKVLRDLARDVLKKLPLKAPRN